jgi:hypothetical protein
MGTSTKQTRLTIFNLNLKGYTMKYNIYDVQQKLIKAVDMLETPVFYSGIEFDVKLAAGLLACPQTVFLAAWDNLHFGSPNHDDLPMFAWVE